MEYWNTCIDGINVLIVFEIQNKQHKQKKKKCEYYSDDLNNSSRKLKFLYKKIILKNFVFIIYIEMNSKTLISSTSVLRCKEGSYLLTSTISDTI